MKHLYRAAAVCLIGVMVVGCGGKKGGPKGAPEGEAEQQKATSVYVENPTTGTIKNQYTYSGTIAPHQQVDVTSTVPGKVSAVYYDVGDYVSAGATLFQMDTASLQNSVKSAQAGLTSAQTALKQVNGGATQSQISSLQNAITNCENSVENAKTALDSAQVNLNKAQSDYDTNKQLFDVGGISQDALTNYENALTQAQNNYNNASVGLKSAEEALSQAQNNYNILVNQTINDNKETAQNAVNSASIALESAKKNLADATVKSPISGTVLECNVTAGATLAGGTPFVIIDQSTVDVEVNASEQIISALSVGSEAEITVSTLSSTFTGYVSEIAPGANTDGTYTVKLNIDNSDGKLKSGMSAKVAFNKEISTDALVLSRDCVLNDDGEYYVFVAEGDKAVKTQVAIGVDGGNEIEITSGISADDLVVTKGQTYLSDGDSLNVVSINGEDIVEKPKEESSSEGEKAPADKKDREGKAS